MTLIGGGIQWDVACKPATLQAEILGVRIEYHVEKGSE